MTNGAHKNSHEWIVVHGQDEDVKVASVGACYRDRDPYGEYVLFAAGDPAAVVDGKISINEYGYLAEARVTFEDDLVAEGMSDIGWCQDDFAEQGDAFGSEIWPSWQDVPLGQVADAIFPPEQDFVMARSVLSVGADFASWVEVTRVEAALPAEMALTFCRAEQDRLLEIKAVLKDPSVPVHVLAGMWQQMVSRFQALPYERLTGAERVEPEEEDGDFMDMIGDVSGNA